MIYCYVKFLSLIHIKMLFSIAAIANNTMYIIFNLITTEYTNLCVIFMSNRIYIKSTIYYLFTFFTNR